MPRKKPAPTLTPKPKSLPALADEGFCPNGHKVWSGGPPTEGEFPLTCLFCEAQVSRPA